MNVCYWLLMCYSFFSRLVGKNVPEKTYLLPLPQIDIVGAMMMVWRV